MLLKNLKKKTVPELLGKDRTTTQSEFRPRVSPSQKLLEGEGTCTSSLIYSDINPMLEDAISAAQNKQNNKTAYTLSRAPRDALKEIDVDFVSGNHPHWMYNEYETKHIIIDDWGKE